MQKFLDNNTASQTPTRFLRAVELITEGRKDFHVYSENWAYPIKAYGHPKLDNYYMEVWGDGMDYNTTYWLIESKNFENPVAVPLMFFDNNELDKMTRRSLDELFEYVYQLRRNKYWIKKENADVGIDEVRPYLKTSPLEITNLNQPFFWKAWFGHGSQPEVEFLINNELINIL